MRVPCAWALALAALALWAAADACLSPQHAACAHEGRACYDTSSCCPGLHCALKPGKHFKMMMRGECCRRSDYSDTYLDHMMKKFLR